MGGGREEVNLSHAEKAGYKVATSKTEMLNFESSDEFGIFFFVRHQISILLN
jgi:hypothetical protein